MSSALDSKIVTEEDIPNNAIPNLSVDNLMLVMQEGELKVLLANYKFGAAAGQWGLVGQWVYCDEDLDKASRRVVESITGVKDIFLEQLAAFGAVNRYPHRRVITVAFYALLRLENIQIENAEHTLDLEWFNVRKLPELVFDHRQIVDYCLKTLKHKIRHEPVGFSLLPEKFTLLQLRDIYEAILDKKLDKPNFRRKILKMNLLIDCNEKQIGVRHRAASLYRFDPIVYTKLTEFGYLFEY